MPADSRVRATSEFGARSTGAAGHLADGVARHPDVGRLAVLGVGPVIPLVGVGHGDDLAGVGGVGQHLLITGHRRVEHGLAEGLSGGAEAGPTEDGPVLQDQKGLRHRWAFPSWTTSSPRNMVWTTLPRRVRPRKAEFLLREANGGSTTHSASGSNATRLASRPGSTGPPWPAAPRMPAGAGRTPAPCPRPRAARGPWPRRR